MSSIVIPNIFQSCIHSPSYTIDADILSKIPLNIKTKTIKKVKFNDDVKTFDGLYSVNYIYSRIINYISNNDMFKSEQVLYDFINDIIKKNNFIDIQIHDIYYKVTNLIERLQFQSIIIEDDKENTEPPKHYVLVLVTGGDYAVVDVNNLDIIEELGMLFVQIIKKMYCSSTFLQSYK